MKLLGLTGGVGMGKSASAQLMRARGIPVIDTDDLAREVVRPGEPALAEIRSTFGAEMVGPDGQLRRDLLGRRVFADPEARRKLEATLHPPIRERWRQQARAWVEKGETVGVVVIPLLFETNAQQDLDATICVACSTATQWQRLSGRKWSPEEIRQRIAAQWPVEKKIAAANYIVWSEGSLELHEAQLDRIFRLYSLPGKP